MRFLSLGCRSRVLLRRASFLNRGGRPAHCARCFSSAPSVSALSAAARKLREGFLSQDAIKEIALEADAAPDAAAVLEKLRHELRAADDELEVTLLGEPLAADTDRRTVQATTPLGPGGGTPVRTVRMILPTSDEVVSALDTRRNDKVRVEKAEELVEMCEKYVREYFVKKREEHIALLAAWGPKTLGDAEGEFAEIVALMELSLRAGRAALTSSKSDFQFDFYRAGDGRDCLVMPPSNFSLLGLKDIIHVLLQGFRVIAVVQPRFYPQYRVIQDDLAACGLPKGLFDVVPGITPEADPEVLHELLRKVDRLQFTGSSAMYKALVRKAYELGNLRLEHAGEVSGMNKIRLQGVQASHPAVSAGVGWAAMANAGELCTSTSLVEFDPNTGDSAESVKAAVENHSFRLGADIEDETVNVLLKPGKTAALEVLTSVPPQGLQEWWEKTVLAVPSGGTPNFRTNESLGHCVYAPTVGEAIVQGVREDASCIYAVGVTGPNEVSARAGTAGCKLPESVFGGMKSHTFAVAGDHNGVGSVQTLLETVRRRAPGWRDNEEAYTEFELTEAAETLLEFLSPKDQASVPRLVGQVLDMFAAFEPEVVGPYDGQPLVGGEGRSQLLSLRALKPTRKNLLIPPDIGLPEDIVKMALLCEMSPLKEVPVTMHVFAPRKGALHLKDPLKSFVRVAERQLGWQVMRHDSYDELNEAIRSMDYPPYFFCAKDRHHLPAEMLTAVSDRSGYVYEGLPSDAVGLFRLLSTSQAWTVSCTPAQVLEGREALERLWKSEALRAEPHATPVIVKPVGRSDPGGFGGLPEDDDWKDLSSDSDSSSDSDEESAATDPAARAKASEELLASLEAEDFVAAEKFTGKREGYVYKLGDKGPGYYKESSGSTAEKE